VTGESRPQRLLLAVLAGTAVAGFATTHRTPPAWLFLLPCALSLFWRWDQAPARLRPWMRNLAYVFLAGAVVLGLILMAYPLLTQQTARRLALLAGYGLAFFSSLFLLGAPAWRLATTFLPVTVGLLVVVCFSTTAPVKGVVALAGFTIFAHLALEGQQGRAPGRSVSAGLAQLGRLALCGLAVLLLSWGIIRFLPWAQTKVELGIFRVFESPGINYRAFGSESRLGDLEELKLSTRVVMRVWTSRPQKLRGRVFVAFDGQTWRANVRMMTAGPAGVERWEIPEPVILRPAPRGSSLSRGAAEWLEAIPGNNFIIPGVADQATTGADQVRTRIIQIVFNGGMSVAPAGTFFLRVPWRGARMDAYGIFAPVAEWETEMYGTINRRDGPAGSGLAPPGMLKLCLDVPPLDPRLKELAERLAAGTRSPEERLERTLAFVESECHYSLKPGRFRTNQPVSEFLFEKKQGYCEYFASAAAVLLRLQGIPSRYVAGWNVQGGNRQGDHYVVREKDAHAWIEAYLPGRGWVEADPTPAAEYEALHAGLGPGRLDNALEWLKAQLAELSVRVRAGDWRAPFRWLWWQIQALLRAVLVAHLWLGAVVIGVVAAAIALAWRWRRVRFRRAPVALRTEVTGTPPELAELLAQLDGRWARLGFARPAWRAPLEHLESLPPDKVPAALLAAGRRAVECFYRCCYAGAAVDPTEIRVLESALDEAP